MMIIEMNAVGAIADYRPFVRAAGRVKAAHHNPASVILTPDLWTELNCLQNLNDDPLGVPRAYAALNEDVSSFLPSEGGVGEDEHTCIVGDLSALTFGVKTSASIEVSRTGEGFRKGSIQIRGYLRIGTYLTQPQALCVTRGITLPDIPGDETQYPDCPAPSPADEPAGRGALKLRKGGRP